MTEVYRLVVILSFVSLGDGKHLRALSWVRLPNMQFKKLVRLSMICQLD